MTPEHEVLFKGILFVIFTIIGFGLKDYYKIKEKKNTSQDTPEDIIIPTHPAIRRFSKLHPYTPCYRPTPLNYQLRKIQLTNLGSLGKIRYPATISTEDPTLWQRQEYSRILNFKLLT